MNRFILSSFISAFSVAALAAPNFELARVEHNTRDGRQETIRCKIYPGSVLRWAEVDGVSTKQMSEAHVDDSKIEELIGRVKGVPDQSSRRAHTVKWWVKSSSKSQPVLIRSVVGEGRYRRVSEDQTRAGQKLAVLIGMTCKGW